MDYGLTEVQQMIREAAGVFADEPNKPQGEAIEYGTSRLADVVRVAGKLGFLGMCLGEEQPYRLSAGPSVCGRMNQVTNTALQMHGGFGYIREYPVERHFRDARILGIIGGPTDVQKRIIGKELMKDADKMAELPEDRLLSMIMG